MFYGAIEIALKPLEQFTNGVGVQSGNFPESVRGGELDTGVGVTQRLKQGCRGFGSSE